jgi:hypothetical protein
MDEGKYEFIFLNPNDPNYKPPVDSQTEDKSE